MNKVILVGNLTRDPELSTTGSNISFCKFSIAVNRTYSNANGERETDFFNIVCWRGLAENCGKYLTKGSKVAISGNIQTRNYEDKDGNKRYSTDIVADDVEFLTSRGSEGGGSYERAERAPEKSGGKVAELKPVEDEDLPF